MGISEPPLLIYTDEELQETEFITKPQIKSMRKSDLARSWVKGDIPELDRDLVFINFDSTDYLNQLIYAVVHELVHLKYPDLEHGDKFEQRINDIMLSGRV